MPKQKNVLPEIKRQNLLMPHVKKKHGMSRYRASLAHLKDTRKLSQTGKRKLLGKIN